MNSKYELAHTSLNDNQDFQEEEELDDYETFDGDGSTSPTTAQRGGFPDVQLGIRTMT
jgi:hypothetical protein